MKDNLTLKPGYITAHSTCPALPFNAAVLSLLLSITNAPCSATHREGQADTTDRYTYKNTVTHIDRWRERRMDGRIHRQIDIKIHVWIDTHIQRHRYIIDT